MIRRKRPRTTATPARPGRGRIALSALVLVLPTIACQAPAAGSAPAGNAVSGAGNPESVSGLRADAWFLPDDRLFGFVEIPAGPFVMGGDPRVDPLAYDNEYWAADGAPGQVDLPTFLIGRYEVTVAQFRAFVVATGHTIDRQALKAPADHPVAFVSWPDALAYARWLEANLEEWPDTPPELARRFTDGWRINLPSEAQWEKAARGADGRIYPWGNEPRAGQANFRSAATTPVGAFECPECPFGLADMSGNLWELTISPYQPYPYNAGDDREDLAEDALFVMRGGHFADPERNVRTTIRGGVDPGARRPFIGFRLVISRY